MDKTLRQTIKDTHYTNGSDGTLQHRIDHVAMANKWVNHITQEDGSRESLLKAYRQWASQYEADLDSAGYMAPALTIKYCAESFPMEKRGDVRILDVGAGTGFVARGLRELGFCHIDALDPSESMLHIARKEQLYNRYICEFLTDKELPIAADTYDAITASGCFIGGHIPCGALHEMIRLAKPGGLIVIVTRHEFLRTVLGYKNRLEPLMEKLEKAGEWKQLARIIEPDYFQDKQGITWKYQVLKQKGDQ